MLNWIYPEVFVNETNTRFKEAFCLGDGKVDTSFMLSLKRFLGVIMIRRIKEDIMTELQLPEKREVTMYLPLTKLQKSLYIKILTDGIYGGNFEIDGTDGQSPMTPPQSPGSENYAPFSASQLDTKATRRSSTTNILMQLRQVS